MGGDVSTVFLAPMHSLTEVSNNLTTTSFTLKEMEMNKTYYWRVDATNTLGTTPGSVWSFKNRYLFVHHYLRGLRKRF